MKKHIATHHLSLSFHVLSMFWKIKLGKEPKFWEQFCWVCLFWEHPKSALKGKNTSKKYFVLFFSLKLLNVPLGSHFNDNNNSDNFPRTAGLKSLPQSKHCVSHSCRKLDFIIPFSSFLLGWICLPTFAQNGYLRNSQNALKKYGIAFSMTAFKKLPHFIKELPGD